MNASLGTGLIYLYALTFSVTAIAEDGPTGALPISKDKFDKIDKREPIPGAAVGEPSPSMRPWFPAPGDQGSHQQSCTAFAVAYGLKTYLERIQKAWNDMNNDHIFSPAYIYNQFATANGTRGIYIDQALDMLLSSGCVPLSVMPYNADDVSKFPDHDILRQARRFRIDDYAAIEITDVDQVKSFLASHVPVVIGAFVDWRDKAWSQNDKGVTDRYLHPNDTKYHAMVAIGYNDDKHAFEVMNSWGPNWNDSGFGWVDYDFWPQFVREGYVARNQKVAPIAPAAGVRAKALDWLPVGPQGLINGNWGFPWNVNLKAIKTTSDKKLPEEVRQYLPQSSSQQ